MSYRWHWRGLRGCRGQGFSLGVVFWCKYGDICVRLRRMLQFQFTWWVHQPSRRSHMRQVFKSGQGLVFFWLIRWCFTFSSSRRHRSKWSVASCRDGLASRWLTFFWGCHSRWAECKWGRGRTEWTQTGSWDSPQWTWTGRTCDQPPLTNFSWDKFPRPIWQHKNQACHHSLWSECKACPWFCWGLHEFRPEDTTRVLLSRVGCSPWTWVGTCQWHAWVV